MKAAIVVLILSLLVGVLVNVMMVWGVYIKFCWLLVPWLVYHMLVILTSFVAPILSIYFTSYIASYGYIYEERKGMVLLAFFPILIGLAGIYFWLVVKALFDQYDTSPGAGPGDAPAKGTVVVNFYGESGGSPVKVAPAPPPPPPSPMALEPSAPPKVVD